MAHSRMLYKAREEKCVYYDGQGGPGRREAAKDQSDAEGKKQTRGLLKAVLPRSFENDRHNRTSSVRPILSRGG